MNCCETCYYVLMNLPLWVAKNVTWLPLAPSLVCSQTSPVGRLYCCWPSPAQSLLASSLVDIYEQDLCSLLDMSVFRSAVSFSTRGGVGFSA
jgi:hypothetical protein